MNVLLIGLGVSIALLVGSNLLQVKLGTFVNASLLKQIFYYALNSILFGLGLGFTGFLTGASIPDENAGMAAVQFAGFGLVVGFVIGLVVSLVWQKLLA